MVRWRKNKLYCFSWLIIRYSLIYNSLFVGSTVLKLKRQSEVHATFSRCVIKQFPVLYRNILNLAFKIRHVLWWSLLWITVKWNHKMGFVCFDAAKMGWMKMLVGVINGAAVGIRYVWVSEEDMRFIHYSCWESIWGVGSSNLNFQRVLFRGSGERRTADDDAFWEWDNGCSCSMNKPLWDALRLATARI